MNEPDYLTERLTYLLSLTFYIAPKLLEDQVFLRSPKILLPISNARHFPRTFLTSPWPGHLDIHTYLACLPPYPFTHGRQLPQPHRHRQRQRHLACICVCLCVRATENVRAGEFVLPFPFLILAPRPAPTCNPHPTPTTRNPHLPSPSASASASHLHLHPGRPYLARAAPAPCACTTAVPQRQHRSISTPSKQNTFGVPSARQLESCLACHRQSRSVLHCYLLHYPTQPARCVSA